MEEKEEPKKIAGFINENSIGMKMFRDVTGGIADIGKKLGLGDDEDEAKPADGKPVKPINSALNDKYADIDRRAQTGEITFRDFMTIQEAYAGMKGKAVPGMPELSKADKEEAEVNFENGRKIVDVMLEEELDEPSLVVEDFAEGGDSVGPRIQRITQGSGVSLKDVGLFVMKFEAMRESTQRIAAGEDPDAIDVSKAQKGNRAAKREAKKKLKKENKKKEKTKM
jgi:signal recognition particle GTPase